MNKYFQIWRNALTKPRETFARESKKGGIREALMHAGLAGLIQGIITAATMMLLPAFSSLGAVAGGTFVALMAVMMIILMPIGAMISILIVSGVYYLFAKLLGGNGTYDKQTYLYAIFYAPLAVILAVLALIPTVIMFLPGMTMVSSLIGMTLRLLVCIYMVYLLTLALKEVHKYSTGKAILTWLIPALILGVIILVFVGAILSIIAANPGLFANITA